jgi:hypothetical protein
MRPLFIVVALFFSPLCLAKEKKPPRPSDRIINVHVPKTGGISLRAFFTKLFGHDKVSKFLWYYDLEKYTPEERTKKLQNYEVLQGHFFFHQLQHLPGKNITFVREPVSRTLSEYRFFKKLFAGKNSDYYYKVHFLPPGNPLYTVQNHQCLFLSSLDPQDRTISISAHLKSAKSNLANRFFFVGLTEDFDHGVRVLSQLMGWPNAETVPELNTTHGVECDVSPELLEDIRKRNWADIELYAYAKQLYEKKLAQVAAAHS